MREIFFCLNQVSYVLAGEQLRRRSPAGSLIAIAAQRVSRQARFRDLHTVDISRAGTLRTTLAAIASSRTRTFVPHQKTGRLIQLCARVAGETALIDDGMDTLRDVPHNLDLARLPGVRQLVTFSDYHLVGRWAAGLQRIASVPLAVLAEDDRPAFDLGAFDTVIVESPGIGAPDRFLSGRGLYVRHPSPVKQRSPPAGMALFPSGTHGLEKSLQGYRGRVVVGESLLLPFLLASADRAQRRLVVQLSRRQYDNLTALHEALAGPAVTLEVG
jgi:hypothetical protein